MRVFVCGTGRCGTVTFARACALVNGFTSAHESHAGRFDFEYPDNHIEVDPHLVWILPGLLEKYPDAKWVVLHRDRAAVVRSLAPRSVMQRWGALAYQGQGLPPEELAGGLFDFMEGVCWAMLPQAIHLTTPVFAKEWIRFLKHIEATSGIEAIDILQRVHNASEPE